MLQLFDLFFFFVSCYFKRFFVVEDIILHTTKGLVTRYFIINVWFKLKLKRIFNALLMKVKFVHHTMLRVQKVEDKSTNCMFICAFLGDGVLLGL